MKKIIVFILLVAACSCTRKTNDANDKAVVQQIDCQSHTERDENGIDIASIDTTEFIVYWNLFRKAVLGRDTTALSTMINDSIDGGWFLLRDHSVNVDKISKSLFLNNLDFLFIPEFLSLLESYEIEKYISPNLENIRWKKVKDKTYKSFLEILSIQINPKQTTFHTVAYYTMSWRRDKEYYSGNYVMQADEELDFLTVKQILIKRDFERLDHAIFKLMFVQYPAGIKLHSVNLSYIIDISN